MVGQAISECIQACNMHGQQLADCILMMLGLK